MKIRSIVGWSKNIKDKFLILFELISFHSPFKLIFWQFKNLLLYLFLYPLLRTVMPKIKTEEIINNFLKLRKPIVLSLPFPFKSKIFLFSDPLVYFEVYIQNIYSKELLKPGMMVLDVGAHFGTYTLLAAEKVGKEGKVIAIEPHPQNYQWLCENIKLNNFQNVIPLNIALSDHEGIEKLYLHFSSLGHSLVVIQKKDSFTPVHVKTVDKLLEELYINKIDIMKIDAEGSELAILKGAEKTLTQNTNIKLLIANHHYPSEFKEVWHFLNNKGFQIKKISGDVILAVSNTNLRNLSK